MADPSLQSLFEIIGPRRSVPFLGKVTAPPKIQATTAPKFPTRLGSTTVLPPKATPEMKLDAALHQTRGFGSGWQREDIKDFPGWAKAGKLNEVADRLLKAKYPERKVEGLSKLYAPVDEVGGVSRANNAFGFSRVTKGGD